jgi:putative oxidoreductase
MRISTLTSTSPAQLAWGIAVLRVIVGLVFLAHGLQKMFVTGITGVADFMGQVGVPLPTAAAIVVTGVETLCGLALVVGFFTRWAAIPLAINMLVAAVIVHLPAGFFLPNRYEYALTLLAACASLSLLGSGAYAVESLLIGRGDSPTTDVRAGAPKAA